MGPCLSVSGIYPESIRNLSGKSGLAQAGKSSVRLLESQSVILTRPLLSPRGVAEPAHVCVLRLLTCTFELASTDPLPAILHYAALLLLPCFLFCSPSLLNPLQFLLLHAPEVLILLSPGRLLLLSSCFLFFSPPFGLPDSSSLLCLLSVRRLIELSSFFHIFHRRVELL